MTNDLKNETKRPGHGGRMSRRRKKEAVLRLLRGDDLEMVSRELGVTAATLSGWQDALPFRGRGQSCDATYRWRHAGKRTPQGQTR